ncbi:hypothetical protein BXY66_3584 [Shimia isoporae]|uniref:Glycerophosphoryl diester phosphodiesterase membrane domain-containing protein n=1 Tax=Shimia isoporae TaxID=647720 RepID=A0A4R1N8K8_9RHOB|nr:hypothetical protein [Shimia isoporae]TCK99880.1 hypothetical protein BXY66_3584 [Shimia isoporae]
MEGWKIFAHSVRLVARNWREALKIFLVPGLIAAIVLGFALTSSGVSYSMMTSEEATSAEFFSGTTVFSLLVGYLAVLIVAFWCVVSWHRYVLLEEYPSGWIPPFRFDRILSYLGHGLLLILVAMVLMVPVFAIIALLASIGLEGLTVVLAIPAYFFVVVIMYRLAPILPAAAIGKPLKLMESLQATKGAAGAIILLLVVSFAVNLAVQLLATLLGMISPVVAGLALFLATLFLMMVNISILTTFYGLYIEGRSID